jgi:hypothetical protein
MMNDEVDRAAFTMPDGKWDASLFGFSVLSILHHSGAFSRRIHSTLSRRSDQKQIKQTLDVQLFWTLLPIAGMCFEILRCQHDAGNVEGVNTMSRDGDSQIRTPLTIRKFIDGAGWRIGIPRSSAMGCAAFSKCCRMQCQASRKTNYKTNSRSTYFSRALIFASPMGTRPIDERLNHFGFQPNNAT